MIREFFVNENPVFLFKPFGLIHNIFTICAILFIIIIIFNRNKIFMLPKKRKNKILKLCAIILLINMVIYTFGNLYFGSFDYKTMLPFHLCFIANYMFIFGILFKKESILKLTIFISFIGPIPAILWPNLVSTIDNFNFWQLIISHHFFMNVSLFSYYALGYKVANIDYIKTFIFLNTLLLIAYPFNKLFDTNYIFTNYIPLNVVKLYPFITKYPTILVLEIIGIIISFIVYRFLVVSRNKELEERVKKYSKKKVSSLFPCFSSYFK